MARNLPYFKFYTGEYGTGDIILCSFEAQGLFTNLCVIYWSDGGNLLLTKAKKRFPMASETAWSELIEEKCIKVENGKIVITFLDKQLVERGHRSATGKENVEKRWGKETASVVPKTKKKNQKSTDGTKVLRHIEQKRTEQKRVDSIVTTVLDNLSSVGTLPTAVAAESDNSIESRIERFRESVQKSGATTYAPRMLKEFTDYWTEISQARKIQKLRFEMEKTWEVGKRLATWASKARNYACFLSDAERSVAIRKQEFAKTIEPHLKTYGREVLNDFYSYWTEKGKDERMRWESEDFWDVGARLKSWKKRDKSTTTTDQTYRIPVPRNQ